MKAYDLDAERFVVLKCLVRREGAPRKTWHFLAPISTRIEEQDRWNNFRFFRLVLDSFSTGRYRFLVADPRGENLFDFINTESVYFGRPILPPDQIWTIGKQLFCSISCRCQLLFLSADHE